MTELVNGQRNEVQTLCFLLRELAVLQLSTQRSERFLFLSWNLPKY